MPNGLILCQWTVSIQPLSSYGLPYIIVTNNGPSFTSNEFKLFNEKNGIKHIFTAPYHPSSNGMSEHSVQTFKNAIKKNWRETVHKFKYNNI